MHLHFKFYENPALFLKTSKNLFQINNFKVRKKPKNIFRNIVFVSVKHVKFQIASFNSNRDIKR